MICFVSSIGMLRCGSFCPVRSVFASQWCYVALQSAKDMACVGQIGPLVVLCGDILPAGELILFTAGRMGMFSL